MKRHRLNITVPGDVKWYLRTSHNGSELITMLIRERARSEHGEAFAAYRSEGGPHAFPEWLLADHTIDAEDTPAGRAAGMLDALQNDAELLHELAALVMANPELMAELMEASTPAPEAAA